MSLAATRFAVELIAHHPELTANDCHILRVLADHANTGDGGVWLSRESVMAETRLSESSVKRSFRVLGELVPSFIRPGTGTRQWQFPPRHLAPAAPAELEAPAPAIYPQGGHTDPPKVSTGGSHRPPGGSHRPGGGVSQTPESGKNRSKNRAPSSPTHPAIAAQRERDAVAELDQVQERPTGGMWRGQWQEYIPGRGLSETLADGDPSELMPSPLALEA